MSLSEIHQISFERYLRKKMTAEEKAEFEEKLAADNSFNQTFQQYKLKRKTYLNELIHEYDSEFKAKTKTTHLIYTLLTLIFLGVIGFLYLDNKQLKQQIIDIYETGTRTIYRTIPFVGTKSSTPPPTSSDSKIELSQTNNEQLDSEQHTLDQEPSAIVEKIKRDELVKDTTLMVALMVSGNAILDTIAPTELILQRTRFWKSPIGFEGYKYDGSLLDLFGIEEIEDVHLFKERNELWMQIGRQTIRAKPDNQYHKL
jgi:hypothetical protein